MGLLSLEQSRHACIAEFTFYGTVMALTIVLVLYEPALQRLSLGGIALAGLASWTLIEYLLHRFIRTVFSRLSAGMQSTVTAQPPDLRADGVERVTNRRPGISPLSDTGRRLACQ